MTDDRSFWRKVLATNLILFNVAIFLFAWLPPSTLVMPERIALGASAFAAIGLFSHAFDWFNLPGEHLSYLITGSVGVYSLVGYAVDDSVPYYVKAPVLCFMASGIASAYAAHVIDGGRRV